MEAQTEMKQEMFNWDLEELKSKQTVMYSPVTEMESTTKGQQQNNLGEDNG